MDQPKTKLDVIANRIETWSQSVRRFEENPPKWFLGLLALLLVIAMVSFRHYG